MTNYDYVQANAFKPDTRHGNLFTDGNGTMYSYGHHYPLLFKVNGLKFINAMGYSNTTAKHISHARSLAQHEVHIPYNNSDISPLAIQKALANERAYILDEIEAIKRKNTKKEARLQQRVNEIEQALTELQGTL
jgi:dihydroorotate dehydrogenase